MTRPRPYRPLAVLLLALAAPAAAAQEAPGLAAGDRVLDLPVMEAVPARTVYAAIAREAGIQVVHDTSLRGDPPISIDPGGRTVEEALDLATRLAGHFWVPMAEDSVLIVVDTPQNRRTHEPIGLRLYALEHVDPKTAVTILRSHLGLRSIALDASRGTVTVRDTAAKLWATQRLLELIDRRPWEVEVDLRLLELPEDALERRMGERQWTRLDPAGLAALLEDPGTVLLGAGVLGMVGPQETRVSVTSAATAEAPAEREEPASRPARPESASVELTGQAEVHRESREVTLDFRMEARAKHGRELVRAEVASAVRLPEGGTLLLPVLPPPGSPGMLGEDRVLAVALTPRIVSDGDVRPEDLEAVWMGTEGQLREP